MKDKALPGEIHRDAIYTVKEFCLRTGIGRDRLRRVIIPKRIAGKPFIVGADWFKIVEAAEPFVVPASRAENLLGRIER